MQYKTILLTSLVFFPMICLSGCPSAEQGFALPFTSSADDKPDSGSTAERFEQSPPQGPTAVESAIELSEKYARASEQLAALKQEKQQLVSQNLKLNNQLQACQQELKQTQKELDEANALLLEMRVELNNWKNDVIGFRDEMRDADKAQLEALLKVLKLLGGEVPQQPDAMQSSPPKADQLN